MLVPLVRLDVIFEVCVILLDETFSLSYVFLGFSILGQVSRILQAADLSRDRCLASELCISAVSLCKPVHFLSVG